MAAIWSHTRLLADIWSMRMFVWVLGRNGELLDSHLFFFDRYSALADYHRSNRRLAKAAKYVAIAEAHYQAAPDDGGDDEPAAAMAMPVPRPAVNTKAVNRATIRLDAVTCVRTLQVGPLARARGMRCVETCDTAALPSARCLSRSRTDGKVATNATAQVSNWTPVANARRGRATCVTVRGS